MATYHNIERSAFRKGEHVGWNASGDRFNIVKDGGVYRATQQTGLDRNYCGIPSTIWEYRLRELSAALADHHSN